MSRVISRTMERANLGCILGGAVGTLLTGAVIALPGLNIVLAPVVAAATVTTVTVSGAAAGTVVGGVAGAISGTKEESREQRRKKKHA